MIPPRATYRVQLHEEFGFEDVAAIAGYLSDLGISHVYCSPYLQAAHGGTHGYDVVDPTRISQDLGGAGAHRSMVDALREQSMGHILDIIPNHMAVNDPRNRWWWDVLKHGRAARYAPYFDIDWDVPEPELRGKVMVPILGEDLEVALAGRHLKLDEYRGEPVIRYYDHVVPLSPDTTAGLPSDSSDVGALLKGQHYLLAHWSRAFDALNYRRFFAINELAALRMESDDVFHDVHELVLELVATKDIDGLRVDHVDGLRDPLGYLERLRAAAPDAYIVVEKILEAEEELPAVWPVEGTSGYDFLNRVAGLFIDPAGDKPLTSLYREFAAAPLDLDDERFLMKTTLLETELATDTARLGRIFAGVCARQGWEEPAEADVRRAINAVTAAMSVYRTYVVPAGGKVDDVDGGRITEALADARRRTPDAAEVIDLLSRVLLLEAAGDLESDLVVRWQQLTGTAMAKGVEDTLFYTYNRLAVLNEVGGDPGRFGVSVKEWHEETAKSHELWPHSMLATSTHDTKRSEDVRARLSLLSEIPDDWAGAVRRWSQTNEQHRTGEFPDRDAEYLLYQTLVGAWPVGANRAAAYMEKASKEAKIYTSWVKASGDYDDALRSFVRSILDDARFTADIERFVEPLRRPGWVNSLAQTLLKLTAPGVPDIYQGQELWDYSLVDPDNRRAVDYAKRIELLRGIKEATPEELWARAEDGAPKLHVILKALELRRLHPDLFDERSGYAPLEVVGPESDHAVAYLRGDDLAIVVPRLTLHIDGRWADTAVALRGQGAWRNVFTGDRFPGGPTRVGELFERWPVALLTTRTED